MISLRSYRGRLGIYIFTLLLFLVTTLVYSYRYSRDVILREADVHIARTAQLLEAHLEAQREELMRYAEIVADDLRIQEYLFIVTGLGTGNEPLRELYERQFGWLPIDRRLLLAENGRILLGEEHDDLARRVAARMKYSTSQAFYIESRRGLEMVAMTPIIYQDSLLGVIVVTNALADNWYRWHKRFGSGHIFVERHGTVIKSTLKEAVDQRFKPRQGVVSLNNEVYRVVSLPLGKAEAGISRLWFGISETRLISSLKRHNQFILVIALLGSGTILFVGIMILRSFSRPLSELMQLTNEITEGRLPVLAKSRENNEIAILANKFADMLQALREKQAEVDRARRQLEQSAITDSLTGTYNRRHLNESFSELRTRSLNGDRRLAGILCDLDHFKRLNDTYGHLAGDRCLVDFANLLKTLCENDELLYRMGGEEFLILHISEHPTTSLALAEKIRTATQAVNYNGQTIMITVSIGIAFSRPDDDEQECLTRLLSRADEALYRSKQSGRNQIHVYDQTIVPASVYERSHISSHGSSTDRSTPLSTAVPRG